MPERLIPLSILLFAAFPLSFTACGGTGPDYGRLDLSSVQGRITLDGQPLAKSLVLFEADDGTFSFGLTDGGGNYRMMFNSEKAGAVKGNKTVRIWSSRGIPGMVEAGGEGDDPDARRDRLERVPSRYNRQSELTVIVREDSERFDFDLQSD